MGRLIQGFLGFFLVVFPVSAQGFSVYTQNLHTWQESEPRDKLNRIADLIAQEKIDLVFFQECGQHEDGTPANSPSAGFQSPEEPLFTDTPEAPGNAAWLVQKRLAEVHGLEYQFYWSQAHIGFSVYQEGSAILSRHKIKAVGQKAISADDDPASPSRREIIWADVEIPGMGTLRAVSTHLGWSQDQDDQIRAMAAAVLTPDLPVVIAGDFNMEPSRTGYSLLAETLGLRDNFMAAAQKLTPGDTMGSRRIDYVWTTPNFPLKPQTARTVFRPSGRGALVPVSDHNGLVVVFTR